MNHELLQIAGTGTRTAGRRRKRQEEERVKAEQLGAEVQASTLFLPTSTLNP